MAASLSKLSLFKRSNGYYYVLFERDGKRRWKSTGASRKTDALKALADFQELLKLKPSSVTLASFVKDFLRYAESTFSRRTVIIYKQALNHLEKMVDGCLLSSLNMRHFDSYKTGRLKSIAPVGVNIELRALKAALNTAVRWKHLESNPFAQGQQARVQEVQPAFFSRAELDNLLSRVEHDWLKDLIVFAVLTGMRQGETVNLRWKDVDLDCRLIHIQSSPTFKTKQGKTRTIPMNSVVHGIISRKLGKSKSEFVFARKGGKVAESYLTHQFKKYVRLAGLNEGLHWHSLRHTHASWLAQDGVSLYAIQKLLGHSSANVTQIYSHLQPSELRAEVERISVSMN